MVTYEQRVEVSLISSFGAIDHVAAPSAGSSTICEDETEIPILMRITSFSIVQGYKKRRPKAPFSNSGLLSEGESAVAPQTRLQFVAKCQTPGSSERRNTDTERR